MTVDAWEVPKRRKSINLRLITQTFMGQCQQWIGAEQLWWVIVSLVYSHIVFLHKECTISLSGCIFSKILITEVFCDSAKYARFLHTAVSALSWNSNNQIVLLFDLKYFHGSRGIYGFDESIFGPTGMVCAYASSPIGRIFSITFA